MITRTTSTQYNSAIPGRWSGTMLLIAAIMLTAVIRDGMTTSSSADAGQIDPTVSWETGQSKLPGPIIGFTLNVHHIGNLPLYLKSVDAIAQLGANTLNVVTPWFQERADSTEMRHLKDKCPTRAQLLAIFQRARERGLRTSLLPIVLLEQPGEDDWRGTLVPTTWDAWWKSYTQFADWFTQLAVDAHVDMLCVGSELNTTEGQLSHWMGLIDAIRERYDGTLSYSANWDRYDKIDLWSLVDVIGISAYFELERDRPDAPVVDLVRAWQPHREALESFARRWHKPLVLSEIGYPSVPWASAHPWNYVAEPGMRADHAAQGRCWEAFFEAWGRSVADPGNELDGFFGYHWDPYHHGESSDTGYGIRGKPALKVIRNGLADIRQLAARLAEQADGN